MEIDAIKKKVLEDVDPETRRKKKKEMRIQRRIVTLQFLGIAAVVILIFYILMGISTVDGNSMYPTLHDKDIVIYNRRCKEYKAGDIVAIARPSGEDYVKRVIAVAGDTVNIQDGKVYVNGEEVRYDGEIGTTEKKSSKITYPLRVGERLSGIWEDHNETTEENRNYAGEKTDSSRSSCGDICGDSRDAAQYGICGAGQHRECPGSRRSGR